MDILEKSLIDELAESARQAEKPKGLRLTTLDNIEEKEVEWLFPQRVPKGEICILGGDGGVGKSSIICNLISAITTGKPSIFDEADGTPREWIPKEKGTVWYFSSEDDFSKVVKPRLKKYNPDFSRIKTIEVDDDSIGEQLTLNSSKLAQSIKEERPTLCIFDPLQSFVPSGVNMSMRNEMRNVINPLIGLGHKYGTTFIIVMHSNKRNTFGRNRLADSADMWDIARSVFLLGHADREGGLYISHEKSSYGKSADTILFGMRGNGSIEFKTITDLKDYEFVTNQQSKFISPARDNAKELLIARLLQEENHSIRAGEMDKYAAEMGISRNTLARAKTELKEEGRIGFSNKGYGANKQFIISLLTQE